MPIHWMIEAGHFAALLGAVVCLGLASMLHEDEERRLQARVKRFQRKVEEWWITLDEGKTLTIAWSTSFIRGIAELTGACFDRVFTTRLISLRIVGISFCMSIASLLLTVLIITSFSHAAHIPSSRGSTFVSLLQFLALALYPAITESQWIPLKPWLPRGMQFFWWVILIRMAMAIGSFLFFTMRHSQNGKIWGPQFLTFVVVIFAISEISDIAVIAFTRWTLRRVSVTKNISGILVSVSFLFLFLLAIVSIPVALGLAMMGHAEFVGLAFLFSIVLNSLDVVVVSTALIVGVFWVALHLVWPLIQRPLYAFQRIDIADKERWQSWKKWLIGLGIFLIGAAIPGLPSWVKELMMK